MKGLLLKDLYMMKTYCKSFLLIAVAFTLLSFVEGENLFFIFYPCMFCGMIPVNLLAYDERSKWLQYSATMPYTKRQIVGSKYIIGLGVQLAMLLITGIAQAIRLSINGTFRLDEYIVLMLLLFVMASITSSVPLPFVFKYGTEKGRMSYYIMIGITCAVSVAASGLFSENTPMSLLTSGTLVVMCPVGIVIYALSWYLSFVFYRNREIN